MQYPSVSCAGPQGAPWWSCAAVPSLRPAAPAKAEQLEVGGGCGAIDISLQAAEANLHFQLFAREAGVRFAPPGPADVGGVDGATVAAGDLCAASSLAFKGCNQAT